MVLAFQPLLLQYIAVLLPFYLSLSVRCNWADPSITEDAAILMLWQAVTAKGSDSGGFGLFYFLGIVFLVYTVASRVLQTSRLDKACSIPRKNDSIAEFWSRPVILPCRTTHSRVFPQKHSFSYSYLFVGIPVGWQGCSGRLLSADNSKTRGWWHVDPADYLARGDGHSGLRGKLDAYLRSQDVVPEDFPFAYLTTAPRFCGYSFNPVSFWYLYSAGKKLKAMILEVNNTFDERRMYFLRAGDDKGLDNRDTKTSVQEAIGMSSSRSTFSNEWKKDFHVSPFNSREGSYKLLAHDPNPFDKPSSVTIANTINLMSSGNHKKLVARVFSTDLAIDPLSMTNFQKLLLVARWSWVGFLTFPRILREAWKLYFKKSLEVFFRPEVAKGSIARHATKAEKMLEQFFFKYLKHVVNTTSDPVSITYRPAPGTGTHNEVILNSTSAKDNKKTHCDFDVLSSVFYTRFVHYAHTSEALDREYLCTDPKNRTIHLSNASLLAKLFEQRKSMPTLHATVERAYINGFMDRIRWRTLQWLRCAAAEQSYPTTSAVGLGRDSQIVQQDIRQVPLSELDHFVLSHSEKAFLYRRQVTMLFLAQRYTLGLAAVVGMADIVLRLCTIIAISKVIDHWVRPDNGIGHALARSVAAIGWLQLYSMIKGFESGNIESSPSS